MENINAVTVQQIESLRKNFNEKVVSKSPDFHPDDLERVKTDDLWLRRFIAHAESNMDNALTLLYDCCLWRKEFGVNELDESKLPPHLFEIGSLFIRGKDKWGKKLLIFKGKVYTKGSVEMELLQKLIVYYFERIERESNSDQISIIFDMKDTGWNNMDMDFVRYLITLLKTYYPYFVNYLIIFEMPWLLNAAWKIIKGWLPPKFVDRVKFQDKKNLSDYIDVDNQLAEWGGNDNYVYKFEPAKKMGRIIMNNNNNIEKMNGLVDASPSSTPPEIKPRTTKVQLVGNQNSEVHDFDYSDSRSTPSPIPNNNYLIDVVDERIVLRPIEGSNDGYSCQLRVKNKSPNGEFVIIKVKTTGPDRYKVRPSVLILEKTAQGIVNIETQLGVAPIHFAKDKFQLQVAVIPSNMIMPDASPSDLGQLFKQVVDSGALLEVYRIGVGIEARHAGSLVTSTSCISLSGESLRSELCDLEQRITDSVAQRLTKIFWIGLALVILLQLYMFYKMQGACSCSCLGANVDTSGHTILSDDKDCPLITP